MKIKKIHNLISCIICMSVILGNAVLAEDASPKTTEGLYKNPVVYMNDDFEAYVLPGEEHPNASGWDVSGGGYITGRKNYGGFWLVDDSTSDSVTMEKKLTPVASGVAKWEISVKPDAVDSVFYATLEDGTNRVIAIELNRGSLYCHTGDGKKNIVAYVKNQLIKVTVYIKLSGDNRSMKVLVNGNVVGENWKLGAGQSICYAKFLSSKGAVGKLNIQKSYLSCDYIIDDAFNNETVNSCWTLTGNASINGSIVLPKDSTASVTFDDADLTAEDDISFEYRFKTDALTNAELMSITMPEEYLENILPKQYYNGDGSLFDETAQIPFKNEIYTDENGDKSIMLSASRGIEMFSYMVPYSEVIELGSNLNLSFDIKKSADATFKSAAGVVEKINHYRLFLDVVYLDASGNRNTKAVGDYYSNTPRLEDNTQWQSTSYNFSFDPTKLNNIPNASEILGLRVHIRPNLGAYNYLTGNVWLDKISLTRVIEGTKLMSLSLTDTGNISEQNNITGYIPDVWYNVKILYRAKDKEADIYVNHMKKQTVSIDGFRASGISFSNTGASNITIDDVIVKRYEKPSDYVPEPVPVKTDYYTSILSCGLWTESGGRGWDAISGFDERSPIIGFYDEGNPEVSDWEIKYMTEHGIDSQIFCWYDSFTEGRNNTINAYKDAEYSDMLNYSIMWTNTGSEYIKDIGDKFKDVYVPFWIEHYFKDERYTRIDGKPVLYIFSGGELMTYFGGDAESEEEKAANVKTYIDYLDNECIKAGLSGVKVYIYNADDALLDNGTTSGKFTYGYMHKSAEALDARYPQEVRSENIPILAVRQNQEAWDGPADVYTTPAAFREMAKKFKNELLPEWDFSKLSDENKKMLIIDNWNEYGEGHFIMPTKTFGFSYLDSFREVFAPNSDNHTDIVPTESQKARINVLYQQQRRRREGSNTASAARKDHIVKLWDYSVSGLEVVNNRINFDDGSITRKYNMSSNPIRLEDGLLKGTVTSTQSLISIEGLNIDIEENGLTSVYINGNTHIDEGGVYFSTSVDDATSWHNNFVPFDAQWNRNGLEKRMVYMKDNKGWTGTLTGIYIRLPVTAGYEFMIESIGLASEGLFELGDELVENGSFEKGITGYDISESNAKITNYDFNRGAAAIEIMSNGAVSQAISGIEGSSTYQFECSAKIPYEQNGTGSLKAYISYSVNGENKKTNELYLESFYNTGYGKLSGTIDIPEAEQISDARIFIENTLDGSTSCILDDVSLRKMTTKYINSKHIADNICDGILLSFEENIDVSEANAICNETGEVLTISKNGESSVVVSLPAMGEGDYTLTLTKAKTSCGEELGVISITVQGSFSQDEKHYYTGYGTEAQTEVIAPEFIGKITGVTRLTNLSNDMVKGNIIAAFYKDNELLSVYIEPFSADKNESLVVEYEFEAPEKYTEFKEFVWDENICPLIKGGE